MGKKPFINKKQSSHYYVVHRSQRDPLTNDPNASKYVLLSSNDKNENKDIIELSSDNDDNESLPELLSKEEEINKSNKIPDFINEYGLINDGYDYSKHFKEMGKGQFYSSKGQVDEGSELFTKKVPIPNESLPSMEENVRMLDAITLTTDLMESDLKEALENDKAFQEIDDDFINQLVSLEKSDKKDISNDDFNYDAHIKRLMDAATNGRSKYTGKDDFFMKKSKTRTITDNNNDSYDDSIQNEEYENENQSNISDLDVEFEKIALEYDDEQIGELDNEEIVGKITLEGDLLNDVIEDFFHIKKDIQDLEGKIGNPLRTGNHLKEIIKECENRYGDEDTNSNREIEPELETEDDGNSIDLDTKTYEDYLHTSKPKETWDCESIVSTYSNLDNHPTVISVPISKYKAKQLKKKEKRLSAKDPVNHIVLSKKTGLPILNLDQIEEETYDKNDDSITNEQSISLCKDRCKNETKEEKKVRKLQTKLLKKERRLTKKVTKEAFKEEQYRQSKVFATEENAKRVSVFRY